MKSLVGISFKTRIENSVLDGGFAAGRALELPALGPS